MSKPKNIPTSTALLKAMQEIHDAAVAVGWQQPSVTISQTLCSYDHKRPSADVTEALEFDYYAWLNPQDGRASMYGTGETLKAAVDRICAKIKDTDLNPPFSPVQPSKSYEP